MASHNWKAISHDIPYIQVKFDNNQSSSFRGYLLTEIYIDDRYMETRNLHIRTHGVMKREQNMNVTTR